MDRKIDTQIPRRIVLWGTVGDEQTVDVVHVVLGTYNQQLGFCAEDWTLCGKPIRSREWDFTSEAHPKSDVCTICMKKAQTWLRHVWCMDEEECCERDAFANWKAPIGTEVEVTKDDGSKLITRTRSMPWMLGASSRSKGHTPVILVEGIAGGYLLTRVRVLRPATSDASTDG